MSLRGILRNAPDWALWVLARDPERFFFDTDFFLSPTDLAPFRDGRLAAAIPHPVVGPGLERVGRDTAAGRWLCDALTRASLS